LLVAATLPPTERTVLLSKLDETIVTADERFELGVNDYGEVISPTGNQFLKSFTKELFPQWTYELNGIQLKKTIAMLHGENTVVVMYDVVKASKPFILELLPLVANKFYHSMNHAGPQMHWDVGFDNRVFHNKPDGALDLFINVPGSSYQHTPRWFTNFNYAVEKYRGQDHVEDLFNHGTISVELKKGDSICILSLLLPVVCTGQAFDTSAYGISVDLSKENDRFFTKDSAWRGADGASSIDMGNGKVLWLFSDSFIAKDPLFSRKGAKFVRNSIAIQQGYDLKTASIKYYWNRSGKTAKDFFWLPGKSWFWTGHGIMVKDRLLIFLIKEENTKKGLGFEATGWYAVLITL